MDTKPDLVVYSDRIHLPCPDMGGCKDFDANLTLKNLERVKQLKEKLFPESRKKKKTKIPARFNQACYQYRKQDEAPSLGADSSQDVGSFE